MPTSVSGTFQLPRSKRKKVSLVTQSLMNSTTGAGAVSNFARTSAQMQQNMQPSAQTANALNMVSGSTAVAMSAIDGATQFQRQAAMHGDCYLSNPNNASACLTAGHNISATYSVAELDEGVGIVQAGSSMRPVPSYMSY